MIAVLCGQSAASTKSIVVALLRVLPLLLVYSHLCVSLSELLDQNDALY